MLFNIEILVTIFTAFIALTDSYVANNRYRHRTTNQNHAQFSSLSSKVKYVPHPEHSRLFNDINVNDKEPAATNGNEPYNVFTDLRNRLKGTSIYLVGMMGSGKTSVGNELAKQMTYRFLDTDQISEFMIEMPISEFFNQGKEEEFRKVEYQVLMELSQYMRVIISTGGGVVLKNENWGMLRHGIVIFMDFSPENIYNRLKSNPEELQKRPLLRSEDPLAKLTELYKDRYEKYMQADVRVEVNPESSVEQVALSVAQGIISFIDANPPMWQEWKRKRDSVEVETAARMNPKATIKANVGFKPAATPGTVTTVNLSDIQSGKVKLPNNSYNSAAAATTATAASDSNSNSNSSDCVEETNKNKGPSKGFQK